MPAFLEITIERLNRLIGTPNCPALIDVRNDEDYDADPRMIPGSVRRDYRDTPWMETFEGDTGVIILPS